MAERIARGTDAGAWVEAVAGQLDSPHAPTRLAAAALAYNLALVLPRRPASAGAGGDAAHLVTLVVPRALAGGRAGEAAGPPPLDGEAALRVLLALGRAVYGSRVAAQRLQTMVPDLSALAAGAAASDQRTSVADELHRMLAAVPACWSFSRPYLAQAPQRGGQERPPV